MSELLRRLDRYFSYHLYDEVVRETASFDQTAPQAAQIWKYRGIALQFMKSYAEAVKCFERALLHLQADVDLYIAMAECFQEVGDHQSAHQYFRRVIEMDPLRVHVYQELLSYENLAPEDPCVDALVARSESPECSDKQRARILFVLGRIYVAAGQIKRGFECYRAGNALMPNNKKNGRSPLPDLEKVLAVDRVFLQKHAPAQPKHPSLCPAVLVAGLPRSGKSLVEKMLAKFPGVVAGGELAYAKSFVSDLQAKHQDLDSLAQAIVSADPEILVRRYRKVMKRANRPDANWVVDTSPATLYRLGLFSLAFPAVPIVFCTREPMDLGVSIFFKKFRTGHEYSYRLETLGEALAIAELTAAHWKQVLPNPWIEVRYEDIVANPLEVVNLLNRFLGFGLGEQEISERFADLLADTSKQLSHPSHAMHHLAGISAAMVGYSKPFLEELEPMKRAYFARMQGSGR
jgi:tetratricopeptide (TPR) repeat protein